MEALVELGNKYAPFLMNYGVTVLLIVFLVVGFMYVLGRLPQSPEMNTAKQTTTHRSHIDDGEGYVLGGTAWNDGGDFDQPENEDDEEDDLAETDEFVPYTAARYSEEESLQRSKQFYELMTRRRTVRMFSDRPVPREVIQNIILTAGTAPSGAHTEPWTYVVVSDASVKAEVRHITELEEKINYERRMGERWLSDLRKLNTDWCKPYLDTAPYLILVFVQVHGLLPNGRRRTHYYHQISASISTGLLIAAIHNAGLVTVTSTPMNAGARFQALFDRPSNEKFMMLLPVGYPAEDAEVPDLHRKALDAISIWK